MSLRDIARHVRSHPVVYQPQTVQAPAPVQAQEVRPIIVAEEVETEKQQGYRGTSINKIAQQMGSVKKYTPSGVSGLNWENCKCLKRDGGKLFCLKFIAYCVKEKCPSKYIEV